MKRTSMLDKAGQAFAETGRPKSQTVEPAKEDKRQPLFLRVPKSTILALKRLSAERQAEGREDWQLHAIATEAFNAFLATQGKKSEA